MIDLILNWLATASLLLVAMIANGRIPWWVKAAQLGGVVIFFSAAIALPDHAPRAALHLNRVVCLGVMCHAYRYWRMTRRK